MLTDARGMAVMIRSAPRRHKGHGAISRANTRPRNLAQLQEGVSVFAPSPSTPIQVWQEAQPRLLCHLHHNPFIAHPEYVTLRADVVGRLKLGLSVDQT